MISVPKINLNLFSDSSSSSSKFVALSKQKPEVILSDDSVTIINVYGKPPRSIKQNTYKILDYDKEKLLSKQIIPNQKFHHPDITDYSFVINELNNQRDYLMVELKVFQNTIKECQDKINRCVQYMNNNVKNHFFTRHIYRNFANTANIHRYTIQDFVGKLLRRAVQYTYLPNQSNGDLIYKKHIVQSTLSNKIWTDKLIFTHEHSATKEGILKDFWNVAVNDTGNRILGRVPQVFQFPNIWPYIDLFFEGVEYILKSERGAEEYTKEEIKAPVGMDVFPWDSINNKNLINLLHQKINSLNHYYSFHIMPDVMYLLGKYSFPVDAYVSTSYFTYEGVTTKLNPIPYTRYKFPYSENDLATMSTQAVNLVMGILQGYIDKYNQIIENEAVKFEATMLRLNAIQDELSFYATLELMRKSFNNFIINPEFPDFPTLNELEEVSNTQSVPMSVAFEMINNKHEFQNVNMAYPNFVTALAISMSLMETRTNFDNLEEFIRKRFLIRATKYIADNIYKNDELIKLVEYRIMLFDKYRNTLTQIDRHIAEQKVDRIVKAVESGDIIDDEVMGRMNKYFHGFVNKHNGTNLVDDTMGFLNIKFTTPNLPLPKFDILKIPEINIINVKFPSSLNPMDAVLSVIGATDEMKKFTNLVVNEISRSSIYVPVISEVVGVGEQVGKGAKDLAEGVWKAGGQFIESTGQFIANSPEMVANIVKATGEFANNIIISPLEKLIDGVAYAILPKDIASKIDSITDIPSKAATGKLTVEDLKEAGQAALKLGVAPLAFAGKISADAIDSAKKYIPLIEDLDNYSGGLLSSGSNIARATHVEYEGKGHSKTLILDVIKVGMVVMSGGSASAVLSNVAETTATNYIVDKTGIGGDEAKAIISAYKSGDFTSSAKDYVSTKAMVEGSKEVEKKTGIPMKDVYAVGKGVQEGKPISQALVDAGEDRAKRDINEEVKKKTGLPVTVNELMNADPSNKKSMVNQLVNYSKNPETLKELVVRETKIAMEKERKKIEDKVNTVIKLAENVQNFNLDKEVNILANNAVKEIDNRQKDLERLDKEIENFSTEDAWEQTKHQARIEKDRAIKNIYEEAYKLKEKYYPEALLNYLMFYFGPKPDYSTEMEQITPDQWLNFELPSNGIIFRQEPYKSNFNPAIAVAGGLVGALVVYNMMDS